MTAPQLGVFDIQHHFSYRQSKIIQCGAVCRSGDQHYDNQEHIQGPTLANNDD